MDTITLTQDQFDALCEKSQIISLHGVYGPKVILMPSGDYLKVFNPKSGLTKRHFFPKYKTFIRNTEILKAAGVPCVQVNRVYFLARFGSYAVSYTPLNGNDLRSQVQIRLKETIEEFVPFLVYLHEKGIFFRGIHLGNVLRLASDQHGLIDVADLRQKSGPLSLSLRVRNIIHLLNNKDDAQFYQAYGIPEFLALYQRTAHLTGLRQFMFRLRYQFGMLKSLAVRK